MYSESAVKLLLKTYLEQMNTHSGIQSALVSLDTVLLASVDRPVLHHLGDKANGYLSKGIPRAIRETKKSLLILKTKTNLCQEILEIKRTDYHD